MKAKREQELDSLKKSINEESAAHEAAMSNLRQKHSHLVEELNGQLESTKKVSRRQNSLIFIGSQLHYCSLRNVQCRSIIDGATSLVQFYFIFLFFLGQSPTGKG